MGISDFLYSDIYTFSIKRVRSKDWFRLSQKLANLSQEKRQSYII